MKKIALALGVAAFVASALPAVAANGWFDPRDPNSLTKRTPAKPYALTGQSRSQTPARYTDDGERQATKPTIEWGKTTNNRQVMTNYDR